MREDIKKALDSCGIFYLGYKSYIKEAEKLIADNEKVLFASPTTVAIVYEDTQKSVGSQGIVFLTDNRVVFYYKPAFKGYSEEFPISEIITLDLKPTLSTGNHIQIFANKKSADFSITGRTDLSVIIYQLFVSIHKERCPQLFQTENKSSSDNSIEQIEKLSDLKNKGIITEEEFQAKKQELLSRI